MSLPGRPPAVTGVDTPILVITRPLVQARTWEAKLAERGVSTRVLPLMAIGTLGDISAVQSAWAGLAGCALVVFVSPNAAASFFAARGAGVEWPADTLAGSTGPGTCTALREAGLADHQVLGPAPEAPSFDSEALWATLKTRDWRGKRVLIVRGDGGRDWLATTLTEHGAKVDFVQAYARQVPSWDAAEQTILAECLNLPQRFVWWLSSSEAVGHLATLAPGADWRASRALASHPRIARSAVEAGFGEVKQANPTLDEVIHTLLQWGARVPRPS